MTALKISVLGPLTIECASGPQVHFISNKARALLVYLAVEHARPHTRAALAALLWPEQSETKAKANLRRALANVRQVIGDGNGRWLQITAQTLHLPAQPNLWVDLQHFRALSESEEPTMVQLEAAQKLVQGEFLEGFSIDSLPFQEWALVVRERTRRTYLYVLHQLTTFYTTFHQPHKALPFAWEQVNVEPWYEPGQRQLLRLLAETQQRATALQHYTQFESALRTALGVQPEAATQQLIAQIEADAHTPSQAESDPPFLAIPPLQPPKQLVSRAPELMQLTNFLDHSMSGDRSWGLIKGEAGSGKTSLIDGFLRQAQKRYPHLIPFLSSCPSYIGSRSAFFPFRRLLSQALGDLEQEWRSGTLSRGVVSRLWQLRLTALEYLQTAAPACLLRLVDPAGLPQGFRLPSEPGSITQSLIFQHFARFLQQLSQQGPILIVIDDVQWIDNDSLELLFYLHDELKGFPICLIVAYRPEEVLPAVKEGGSHKRLGQLIQKWRSEAGGEEVDLHQTDGRAFVDAWLDRQPNRFGEPFRETLFGQTAGHALFTIELVADLQDSGMLQRDAQGYWQVGDDISWEKLPARTEALIAERIQRLPPAHRELLAVAAVQGETFVAEVVAQILERPLARLIPTLSRSLSRTHRLVQPIGRQSINGTHFSRYRFRHHLFREYIYQQLGPIERSSYHLATGKQLQTLYESANVDLMPRAAVLAQHFEMAQAGEEAFHFHRLAGQHALTLSAHSQAAHHYRRCLAELDRQPESRERQQQEIEIQLALGAAIIPIEGYASAGVKRANEQAFELCQQVEAVPEMVTSLFWLASYYAVTGDLPKAGSLSNHMLSLVRDDQVGSLPKMQAHILSGLPLLFMGRYQAALDHFQQASQLYEPAVHRPLVHQLGQDPGISAKLWEGHTLLHLGEVAAARSCLTLALDWAEELSHPYTSAFVYLLGGGTPNHGYQDELEVSAAYLKRAQELARRENFVEIETLTNFSIGYIEVSRAACLSDRASQKRAATGLKMMEQALEQESRIGNCLGSSSRWILLADSYRSLGELVAAWSAIKAAKQEIMQREERYFEPELWRITGKLHQTAGDVEEGISCWEKGLRVAQEQQARLWELRLSLELKPHKRSTMTPRLRRVLRELEYNL